MPIDTSLPCYTPIRGLAARITRLDSCGVPVSGANNSAVTCGYTQIAAAADIEAATDILVKNAAGEVCCNQKGCPTLKGETLTIDWCQVDPEFLEIATGTRLLVAPVGSVDPPAGTTVGYAAREKINCDGFALEVWQELCIEICTPGVAQKYVYTLYPRVINGVLGDYNILDGASSLQMTAYAQANPSWGDPYGVGQSPSLTDLEPYLQFVTSMAPPTCACGYSATPVP